ncbi:MAG: hypothetical protein JSU59_10280 [Nitrospirota bacterium]|nr:MAG: hypothetical protein JSU59_10280 [Nitrospirota bacterium]
MKKDIPDTQDKTLVEKLADLGDLIIRKEREESLYGSNIEKTTKFKQLITLQKRLVRRMINGDEEEFLPPRPKKPQLRIIK